MDPVTRMGGDGVVEGARSQKGDRGERPGSQTGIQTKQDETDPHQLDEGNQSLLDPIDKHAFHVHHVFADPSEKIAA